MKPSYRHGLEHLGGNNDGLASLVALRDHHLLCQEDLAGGDLNAEITTGDIYRGAIPFVCLQVLALALLWTVPQAATWLPRLVFPSAAPIAAGSCRRKRRCEAVTSALTGAVATWTARYAAA